LSKLDLKRIFLKDSIGNYFRLFSISNPNDKKGEYYIKAIFSNLRNVPLIGLTNIDEKITKQELMLNGIQEFSFHYNAGVSHYKDNSTSFIDRQCSLPTLKDFPALHLFRYVIYDISQFSPYDKTKISKNDFILPREFNGMARGFEVFISTKQKVREIASPEENVIPYKINLSDKQINLFIADGFWQRKSDIPNTYTEIFRYDNPTDCFH